MEGGHKKWNGQVNVTPEKHVVVVEDVAEVNHEVHLPHSHLLSSTATPGLEEQIRKLLILSLYLLVIIMY